MDEILKSLGVSEDHTHKERKEGEGEKIYCGRQYTSHSNVHEHQQQEVHNEYSMRIVTKAMVKDQSH